MGGSLFDATMNNAANSKQQEALGKQSDRLITEATTNSDAAHLDVIDVATRATLQDADKNTRIASSATDAAGRVAIKEHADDLINNPLVAKDSGGIDEQGETLVVAQAYETLRKAYDSNVAAYGVRLREAGTPDSISGTLGRADVAGDKSLLGTAMDTSKTSASSAEVATSPSRYITYIMSPSAKRISHSVRIKQ
ncbi:hypothetical protein BH09PAT4_BH09PAT4_09270 [soil metagenome]